MQSNMYKSGLFAQRAGVSKKALQIYMDKGILVPDHIDAETGYRYYSVAKLAKLDEIIKMRQIGFSLDEIKELFENQEPLEYLNKLNERLCDTDDQIKQAQKKKNVIQSVIDNQMVFLNPPSLHHCFVEYLPERLCMRFPIGPVDAQTDDGKGWLNVLDKVKAWYTEYNVPLMYFSNVGAIFDAEELRKGRMIYHNALVLLKESTLFPHVETLPAGYYATMYDQRYMSDTAAISSSVSALLDFVERNNYEICGDYIQHIVAETTMFDFNRLLYIVKEQVPIQYDN